MGRADYEGMQATTRALNYGAVQIGQRDTDRFLHSTIGCC